jgi:hypothetical protein
MFGSFELLLDMTAIHMTSVSMTNASIKVNIVDVHFFVEASLRGDQCACPFIFDIHA